MHVCIYVRHAYMHMYISGIRVERKLLDKKMRSKEQRAERGREGTRIHII